MPRTLSGAQIAALQTNPVEHFSHLIKLDTYRWTTGSFDITHGAELYVVNPGIISLSDVEESSGLSFNSMTLVLDFTWKQLVLTDNLNNRNVELFLLLNYTTVLPLASMNVQAADIVGDEIKIKLETRFQNYDQVRGRKHTVESQQQRFPGDLGFSYASELDNKVIEWGW